MEDDNTECPNCGEIVYAVVEKDTVCFDEIVYSRRCPKCGHLIDSFSVKK